MIVEVTIKMNHATTKRRGKIGLRESKKSIARFVAVYQLTPFCTCECTHVCRYTLTFVNRRIKVRCQCCMISCVTLHLIFWDRVSHYRVAGSELQAPLSCTFPIPRYLLTDCGFYIYAVYLNSDSYTFAVATLPTEPSHHPFPSQACRLAANLVPLAVA